MQRTHFAFALLILPLAAACGTAGYAVPGELSAVSAVPVHGRQGVMINQRLSFGSYSTDVVRRSATRGREQSHEFATETGEFRQRYEFALNRAGSSVASVRCDAQGFGAQTLNVSWRSRRTLECTMNMAGGDTRVIRLESMHDRPLAGRVTGDPAFGVTGSNRVRGGTVDGTAGYTITADNGTPVAAVSVVGNGAVYPRAAEDDTVATVIAALLLYQDPMEASERFRS